MLITPQIKTITKVEGFTIALSPRELELLCTLLGSMPRDMVKTQVDSGFKTDEARFGPRHLEKCEEDFVEKMYFAFENAISK